MNKWLDQNLLKEIYINQFFKKIEFVNSKLIKKNK